MTFTAPGQKGTTSVVRVHVLLVAEAEEAVARVWRVLEAHRIATPHMTLTHRSGITIELSFASSHDAERVDEALRGATFLHVGGERAG